MKMKSNTSGLQKSKLNLLNGLKINLGWLMLLVLIGYSLTSQAQTANGRFLSWDFSPVSATNITTWPVYFGNTTYIDTAGDAITQGAGLNPGATAVAGAMTFQGINAGSEAVAVTNGDYVEFQITPKAGFEARLDSLIYRWQYQNASATINAFVRTSLDNYATTVGSISAVSNATAYGNNVSKITFANPIYIQTTVTVRLYLWNAIAQNRDFRFTDGTTNNSFNHDISFWGRTTASKSLMQAFDFSSSLGSETSRPTYTCNNTFIDTTGVTITRGSGLAAQTTTAGSYGANNFNTASEANAITGNDYFEFSLKPKSGYEYSLDRILIRYFATTGVTNYSLRSSQNNYTSTISTGTLTQNVNSAGFINLTTPLASDSAITYRLYLWTTGTTNLQFRFTDGTANNTFNYDIAFYGDLTTATIPQATLSVVGSSSTCLGGGISLKVATLGGTAPFTVWLKDNLGQQRIHTQTNADTTFTIFPQSNRTYTLDSVKDVMSHKATQMSGTANVTVTASPVISSPGTTIARTLNHLDGLTLTYANGDSCKSWVRIADSVGGTNPGSTTCTAAVLNAIPTNSTSRYFISRHVRIQPTTNGVANVTLFFPQSEFTAYNTAAGYHQKLPATPTDTAGVLNKLQIRRTQNSTETDSLTSFTPSSVTWNSSNAQWEVTFRVNDGLLHGYYYVSTPFNTTKMVTGLTHIANTPVAGQSNPYVVVDWDSIPNVTQYRIRFRPQGGSWNASTVTGSQRIMTTLAYNTTYEVQVRVFESQLGANVQGEYTKTYTFTTPAEPGKLPTCQAPTSTSVTLNSPVSTTITWSSNVINAASFIVQMRPKNGLVWGGTSTNTNSVTFTALSPNTTYEYRVRTECTSGYTENGTSAFTAVDTFRTPALAACGSVTNLNLMSVSQTSAQVKWSPVQYASAYQVEMRLKNTATWGGTTTSDTTFTFNNLSAGSIYEYRVRTFCNNPSLTSTASSVFSTIAEFTTNAQTLTACLAPSNIQTAPTANAVVVTWDTVLNGMQYFVNLKAATATTWGGTTVSTNTRTFSNLSPSTNYQVRIRTVCTPGTTFTANSAFSDTVFFVTTALANKFETGMNESSIRIYPNPTSNLLYIDFNSSTNEPVQISMRDMTGRLIHQQLHTPLVGENNTEINMSNLSEGLYLITLTQQGQLLFMNKIQKSN